MTFNRRYTSLFLLCIFILITLSCDRNETIRLGFVGCLTGRLSDLGISGRNGATLAVENINSAGGINGRKVELVTRNDENDPMVAYNVTQELIEEDVEAIIGHMTSTMSLATVPLMNDHKMLLISPTTSTNELSGIDDYFLRVTPESADEAGSLSFYAHKNLNIKTIAAIYDLSNQAFSETWLDHFRRHFESNGGELLIIRPFTSGKVRSYYDFINDMVGKNPDGFLIIAGALDTAMFCQQLMKMDYRKPVISSGWASTPDLISNGGGAVENIVFSHTFDEGSRSPDYLEFKEQYFGRFGKSPDFAAVNAYEAAHILFQALPRKTPGGNPDPNLITNQTYQGLQGSIYIDRWGDCRKERFFLTVKDGQFVRLQER